jgi:hypothetical protein
MGPTPGTQFVQALVARQRREGGQVDLRGLIFRPDAPDYAARLPAPDPDPVPPAAEAAAPAPVAPAAPTPAPAPAPGARLVVSFGPTPTTRALALERGPTYELEACLVVPTTALTALWPLLRQIIQIKDYTGGWNNGVLEESGAAAAGDPDRGGGPRARPRAAAHGPARDDADPARPGHGPWAGAPEPPDPGPAP